VLGLTSTVITVRSSSWTPSSSAENWSTRPGPQTPTSRAPRGPQVARDRPRQLPDRSNRRCNGSWPGIGCSDRMTRWLVPAVRSPYPCARQCQARMVRASLGACAGRPGLPSREFRASTTRLSSEISPNGGGDGGTGGRSMDLDGDAMPMGVRGGSGRRVSTCRRFPSQPVGAGWQPDPTAGRDIRLSPHRRPRPRSGVWRPPPPVGLRRAGSG
jgi:hypothetical protein